MRTHEATQFETYSVLDQILECSIASRMRTNRSRDFIQLEAGANHGCRATVFIYNDGVAVLEGGFGANILADFPVWRGFEAAEIKRKVAHALRFWGVEERIVKTCDLNVVRLEGDYALNLYTPRPEHYPNCEYLPLIAADGWDEGELAPHRYPSVWNTGSGIYVRWPEEDQGQRLMSRRDFFSLPCMVPIARQGDLLFFDHLQTAYPHQYDDDEIQIGAHRASKGSIQVQFSAYSHNRYWLFEAGTVFTHSNHENLVLQQDCFAVLLPGRTI